MAFSRMERGAPNSLEYRVFIKDESSPISALHDVPLCVDSENKIYNMIVLAPRWTNPKMQISMRESLNPIKQESRKAKLRYIPNCFPHHGYIWNYGIFPQTWKNSDLFDDGIKAKVNHVPIEVIEVGDYPVKIGEVAQVKILGTFALMYETSWKIVAINVKNPVAAEMNDISDVEKHFPGLMKATIELFKMMHVVDGKPVQRYLFGVEIRELIYAENLLNELHRLWKMLINNQVDAKNGSLMNTTIVDSYKRIGTKEAVEIMEQSPPFSPEMHVDDTVDKWHYVTLK